MPHKRRGTKGIIKTISEAGTFGCGDVFTIFIHYVKLYRISLARIHGLEEQAAIARGKETRRIEKEMTTTIKSVTQARYHPNPNVFSPL